jgi:hypothetical protein
MVVGTLATDLRDRRCPSTRGSEYGKRERRAGLQTVPLTAGLPQRAQTFVEDAMSKARSGFTPGVATGSTPSQGGSHSAAADPSKRVITQATHPGAQAPIGKAPVASKDGVILTPRPETHQGWFRNEGVDEVEV